MAGLDAFDDASVWNAEHMKWPERYSMNIFGEAAVPLLKLSSVLT